MVISQRTQHSGRLTRSHQRSAEYQDGERLRMVSAGPTSIQRGEVLLEKENILSVLQSNRVRRSCKTIGHREAFGGELLANVPYVPLSDGIGYWSQRFGFRTTSQRSHAPAKARKTLDVKADLDL